MLLRLGQKQKSSCQYYYSGLPVPTCNHPEHINNSAAKMILLKCKLDHNTALLKTVQCLSISLKIMCLHLWYVKALLPWPLFSYRSVRSIHTASSLLLKHSRHTSSLVMFTIHCLFPLLCSKVNEGKDYFLITDLTPAPKMCMAHSRHFKYP